MLQVHPQEYNTDMVAILGFVLKHDDSVNDRSEGSKLNNADEVTRRLWMEEFNVPFARPGSMFRGNPPQGKLFSITTDFQRSLLAPREMDVTVSSVKITDLPKLDETSIVLSVQLETDEGSQKLNKKKKTELYNNLLNLSDENELEVKNPEGLLQFTATHTNQPKINIKAVKPGKKSSVAAWFGCNPRNESVAQSECPIDVFSLAKNNIRQENCLVQPETTVTVSHRMATNAKIPDYKHDKYLPTEVTISMANERLGQQAEVVFSIQEGSFYNCVMPGTLILSSISVFCYRHNHILFRFFGQSPHS